MIVGLNVAVLRPELKSRAEGQRDNKASKLLAWQVELDSILSTHMIPLYHCQEYPNKARSKPKYSWVCSFPYPLPSQKRRKEMDLLVNVTILQGYMDWSAGNGSQGGTGDSCLSIITSATIFQTVSVYQVIC